MTREQMIDEAVRRELDPMWQRHFLKYPEDLSTVVFRDTETTALVAIRAECLRIAKSRVMEFRRPSRVRWDFGWTGFAASNPTAVLREEMVQHSSL